MSEFSSLNIKSINHFNHNIIKQEKIANFMYVKRDYLEKNVGNTITVQGKIAVAFWQHMTKFIETHPNMIYFDLEDGYQIMVYSKNDIACKGIIEIRGKVIELESDYKNPNVKIQDKFSEYHIIVDSWRCID